MPHSCPRCDALPDACKGALVDRAERAEKFMWDSGMVRGWFWKKRATRLAELYSYAQDRATKQQLRADRLQSRAIKAEKALRQYERGVPRRWRW